ncbi:hypothetical protein AB0364_29330, partial [Klebsiella pneumoniae]
PPRDKPAKPSEADHAKADHEATAEAGEHKGNKPAAPAEQQESAKVPQPSMGVAGLKIFAVLLAIALAVSTLLGIVIALQTPSMRRTGVILLVIGTV